MKKLISIVLMLLIALPLLSQHSNSNITSRENIQQMKSTRQFEKIGNNKFQVYDVIKASDFTQMNIDSDPHVFIDHKYKKTVLADSIILVENVDAAAKIVILKEIITVDSGITKEQMINAYKHPSEPIYDVWHIEKEWNHSPNFWRHSKIISTVQNNYVHYDLDAKHVFRDLKKDHLTKMPGGFSYALDWWLIVSLILTFPLLFVLDFLSHALLNENAVKALTIIIFILYVIILFQSFLVFVILIIFYIIFRILLSRYRNQRKDALYKELNKATQAAIVAGKSFREIETMISNMKEKLSIFQGCYADVYVLDEENKNRIKNAITQKEKTTENSDDGMKS